MNMCMRWLKQQRSTSYSSPLTLMLTGWWHHMCDVDVDDDIVVAGVMRWMRSMRRVVYRVAASNHRAVQWQ